MASPSSGRGLKRGRGTPVSGIQDALGLFHEYLKQKSDTISDEEFQSFSLQVLLLFLIVKTIKNTSQASTLSRNGAIVALFESLAFPSAMASNSEYEINADVLHFIALAEMTDTFLLFHCDAFPEKHMVTVLYTCVILTWF